MECVVAVLFFGLACADWFTEGDMEAFDLTLASFNSMRGVVLVYFVMFCFSFPTLNFSIFWVFSFRRKLDDKISGFLV